jgi:hypothetical protein
MFIFIQPLARPGEHTDPHRLPLFRGSQLRTVKPRCRTLLSAAYLKSKYSAVYPVLTRAYDVVQLSKSQV